MSFNYSTEKNMNKDNAAGFLDNTSLLTTPRSPKQTSTNVKENARRKDVLDGKGNYSTLFNSMFSNVTSETVLPLSDATNVQKYCEPQVLAYDQSTHFSKSGMHDATSHFDEDSSLGIISLRSSAVSDITESLFNDHFRESKIPSAKRQPLCNEPVCSTSKGLKSNFPVSSGCQNVLEALHPNDDDNLFRRSALPDFDVSLKKLQETLSNPLTLNEINNDAKDTATSVLESSLLNNEIASDRHLECPSAQSGDKNKNKNSAEVVQLVDSPDILGPKLRESMREGYSMLLKTLLEPIKATSCYEETFTPAKTPGFIDTSSFQYDEIYKSNKQKSSVLSNPKFSEAEMVFNDDQISARSTSLGSSPSNKSKSLPAEESVHSNSKNLCDLNDSEFRQLQDLVAVNQDFSVNQLFGSIDCDNISLGMDCKSRDNSVNMSKIEIAPAPETEGKKSEISSTSEINDQNEVVCNSYKNVKDRVASVSLCQDFTSKMTYSSTSTKHFPPDLAHHTNLLKEGPLEMVADGDDWELKLGLSQHEEFYTPDAAAEIMKQNEEEFEQENKFQVGANTSVASQFSMGSFLQQSKISRPSWWSDVNDSKVSEAGSHVSVGQFIRAKTEVLGSLSDDKKRERPHFGTAIGDSPCKSLVAARVADKTDCPQKLCNSSLRKKMSFDGDGLCVNATPAMPTNDVSALVEHSSVMSFSSISNLLAEASTDEPSLIVSKFLKCSKKTSRISSKKTKSFLKEHVDSLKTIEEHQNCEIQQLNDFNIGSNGSSAAQSLNASKYSVEQVQKSKVSGSSLHMKAHLQSAGNDSRAKQSKDSGKDYRNKLHMGSKESQSETKGLSSVTGQGNVTEKMKSPLSVQRSKSLNCLCSNPSCESHILRKQIFVGDGNSARCVSLENISAVVEDSGFCKTETEVNGYSVSTSVPLASGCNRCVTGFQHRTSSTCSDVSAKGPVNLERLRCMPFHQNVMCAPTCCLKQFHACHCHASQPVSSIGINSICPAGQNTQPTIPNADFVNTMETVHVAAMPVYQGALFGCPPVSHSISGSASTTHARVEVPSKLTVPKEVCVGDNQFISLPLHNPLAVQIFCHIRVSSVKINDTPILPDISGFSAPKIIQINNSSTDDLKIEFTPRQVGKTIATLEIIPSFSMLKQQSIPESSVSVMVSCEAVNPLINLQHNGLDKLDFGSVIGGSTISKRITLSNLGKADVPVQLIISGDVKEKHSVRFALQDINSVKDTSNINWHFISPKVIFCRIIGSADGSENKVNVPVALYAGEYESQQGNNSAEVISGSITAVLGTPKSDSLAAIRTSATIGKVLVELKHSLKKPLTLQCKEGSRISQSLTVVNKGNIAVTVDLAILNCEDCFVVSPPTISLQSFQEASIAVTYTPSGQTKEVKGSLQAAVHHSGQVFDLAELIGEAISQVSSTAKFRHPQLTHGHTQATGSGDSVFKSGSTSAIQLIETNKKYLNWGGVDIGKAIAKTFVMRNPSKSDVLQVKLCMKQKLVTFQLDDDGVLKEALDIKLNPGMEKAVKIVFQPADTSPVCEKLTFKPNGHNGKRVFSIPLSGYGGISKVKILNVPHSEGFGYCLDIAPENQFGRYLSKIPLFNEGDRPAYVKLVCFSDESLDFSAPNTKMNIQPSEFILLEKASKDVLVTYKPEDLGQHGYQSSRGGIVVLFYGDEIMRQKMRRSQGKSAFDVPPPDDIKGISFDATFLDEDKVIQSSSYPDSPKDASLFYSSMERLVIHLTIKAGDQSSSSTSSFSALSMFDDSGACGLSNETVLHRSTSFLPWNVEPEELTLSSEKWDRRLLLTNESVQDLKFKLSWSVNYICVSPVQGLLPAKSQIGLRVQIVPHCQPKLAEPADKCFIKIHCGGQEKLVLVKACASSIKEKQTLLPHNTVCGTSTSLQQTTCDISAVKQLHPLRVPEIIGLSRTCVGVSSESTFQLENIVESKVQWVLLPVDGSLNKKPAKGKVASNILKFVPYEGVVEQSQSVTVTVKFTPCETGFFSQQWEVQMKPFYGKKSKAQLALEGMVDDKTAVSASEGNNEGNSAGNLQNNYALQSSATQCRQNVSSADALKPKKHLYCSVQLLEFPVTEVGKTSTLKLPFKNPSLENVKATIVSPLPPFYVKYTSVTVKAKYYQHLPIQYKPIKAEASEWLLVIRADDGIVFEVKLKGTSVLPQKRN